MPSRGRTLGCGAVLSDKLQGAYPRGTPRKWVWGKRVGRERARRRDLLPPALLYWSFPLRVSNSHFTEKKRAWRRVDRGQASANPGPSQEQNAVSFPGVSANEGGH